MYLLSKIEKLVYSINAADNKLNESWLNHNYNVRHQFLKSILRINKIVFFFFNECLTPSNNLSRQLVTVSSFILALLLFSLLLRVSFIDWSCFNERNLFPVNLWHEIGDCFWNGNASLGLIYLQYGANNTSDRAQCGIQHVNVIHRGIHLFSLSIPTNKFIIERRIFNKSFK